MLRENRNMDFEDINPYELYLKVLYEHFKDEINQDKVYLKLQKVYLNSHTKNMLLLKQKIF